ncbi:MAG: RusA family crossover junction endodeoxyribonuclease [Bilifractor sp.]|nr:RusA family crossover junction endodeoxyribonuclease [Lachnospiraceae bacterium]MDY2838063.1 RusA family crossover junction endodeoxyribonuclease [Bilifractor sp.]
MKFFVNCNPPTATAQEKKVALVKGRVVFYEPSNLKAAKSQLTFHLLRHRPKEPLKGPLSLTVLWLFPKGKNHKDGTWRITRPDTDNLEKMLKDCMTRCGFWKDDAQVVKEYVEKKWSENPVGIEIEIVELEGKDDEPVS